MDKNRERYIIDLEKYAKTGHSKYKENLKLAAGYALDVIWERDELLNEIRILGRLLQAKKPLLERPIPFDLEQSIRSRPEKTWIPWERESIEKVDEWRKRKVRTISLSDYQKNAEELAITIEAFDLADSSWRKPKDLNEAARRIRVLARVEEKAEEWADGPEPSTEESHYQRGARRMRLDCGKDLRDLMRGKGWDEPNIGSLAVDLRFGAQRIFQQEPNLSALIHKAADYLERMSGEGE